MINIEQAIQDYIGDVRLHQSPQTAETYEQGMRRFVEFLINSDYSTRQSVEYLSADTAIAFARWLAGERDSAHRKLAKSTLRTYLASIKRFYGHLLQRKLIELSMSDFQQLIEAFHGSRHGRSALPEVPPNDVVVGAPRRRARSQNPAKETAS
jgi:site-specific recombinase XerD